MRPFKSEHYYQAALERIRQAEGLYQKEASYALAMYAAGVAVECLLRAFKARRDPTFDERHDLLRLFKASGLLEIGSLPSAEYTQEQISSHVRHLRLAVNEIYLLWSNDFRYASEDRLRAHLRKDARLRAQVKGDVLKASARRLIAYAREFVDRGYLLWNSSKRPRTS
jgi:HEPN domain